ncbi:MAG: ABC transporter permease [Chloroflexi bacterium]|nr:ABC transporter permease [Chloroflexota bacterium]
MKNIRNSLKEISKYPSAIFGMIIILLLVALAIYAVFTIPYGEAVRLWRGGEDTVYRNPKNVPPSWFNNFTDKSLPISVAVVAGEDEEFTKVVTPGVEGSSIEYEYSFDFQYDEYPQELFLYIQADYQVKNPFISITLETPGGEEIRISDFGTSARQTYRFSQDDRLETRLRRLHGREVLPIHGLFSVPESDPLEINKGVYTLKVLASTFEENSDVRIEFVSHGLVFGLFGTDHMRRDLTTAILWGAPIALAFGLLAAATTSVLSMLIAAIGAWFGGWVDELIQRITEVNLVLPFFSVLIMVGTFYSRSIWVILGVTIALSIFTGAIKTNRAIFLQVKESTYIEAARAYGASNSRIIVRYLVPRIIPMLIPGLVSAVPSYVFLEASLALLGLGDPTLPTWGKVINDAYTNGALYRGQFYWILEPAVLLMITGLGFAMLGFALDRIFNPRLRGM